MKPARSHTAGAGWLWRVSVAVTQEAGRRSRPVAGTRGCRWNAFAAAAGRDVLRRRDAKWSANPVRHCVEMVFVAGTRGCRWNVFAAAARWDGFRRRDARLSVKRVRCCGASRWFSSPGREVVREPRSPLRRDGLRRRDAPLSVKTPSDLREQDEPGRVRHTVGRHAGRFSASAVRPGVLYSPAGSPCCA